MSRIGKLPIMVPKDVTINYNESEVTVKGKFGTLQTKIPNTIGIRQDNNTLKVDLNSKSRKDRSLHGLYRTLIRIMDRPSITRLLCYIVGSFRLRSRLTK